MCLERFSVSLVISLETSLILNTEKLELHKFSYFQRHFFNNCLLSATVAEVR